MSTTFTTSGRLCVCEWSETVSVEMVATLLAYLKQLHELEKATLVLIVRLDNAAARAIVRATCPFLDLLSAIWSLCQELVVTAEADPSAAAQLRRALLGSAGMLVSTSSATTKHVRIAESLDEAFEIVNEFVALDALQVKLRRVRGNRRP